MVTIVGWLERIVGIVEIVAVGVKVGDVLHVQHLNGGGRSGSSSSDGKSTNVKAVLPYEEEVARCQRR